MANEQWIPLFSNQASSANSAWQPYAGGEAQFTAWGGFGGGTCKLQWSPDGSVALDVDRSGETYVTFTAPGHGRFTAGAGYVRAVLSGATGATLSADVRGTRS